MHVRAVMVWVCLAGCRGYASDESADEQSDLSALSTIGDESNADTDTDTGSDASFDPGVDSYVPSTFPPADPVRVIFLGDSITDGAGVADQSTAYASLLVNNNDEEWPGFASADLQTRYPGIEVIDVSRGGATTEDVLGSQVVQLAEILGDSVEGATLVVGTIGGNDVTEVLFSFGNLVDEVDGIAANVDAVAAWFDDDVRFPDGAWVYLTNVYEPTDAVGQADECFFGLDLSGVQPSFDALNASTRVYAETNGWAWVDLRGHFLGHGFNHDDELAPFFDASDPSLWLAKDCIHPNRRGHHEVRRLFLAALENHPLPK